MPEIYRRQAKCNLVITAPSPSVLVLRRCARGGAARAGATFHLAGARSEQPVTKALRSWIGYDKYVGSLPSRQKSQKSRRTHRGYVGQHTARVAVKTFALRKLVAGRKAQSSKTFPHCLPRSGRCSGR